MEQNSTPTNRQTDSEYSFPQNKEQFQKVLQQAQQGQYQQAPPVSEELHTANSANTNNVNTTNTANTGNTYSYQQGQTQQYNDPIHYSADDIPQQNDFNEYQQPVYSSSLTPVKKRLNPLVIILPVILAIIAAAVVFFILLNNTVSYRKAEENYFNSLSSMFFEKYTESSGENGASAPQKAEIKISIPAAELSDIGFNEISLKADTAVSGETFYSMLDAAFGELNVTLENWTDRETLTNILFIPEISDLYLYLKTNPKEDQTEDFSKIYDDIYGKLTDIYFELTGDPKIEKNVEFTADGRVFKADRYIVRLNGTDIAKLIKGTAETLLDNESAAAALCRFLGYKNKAELLESESYQEMIKELDDIINGVKTDETSFLMSVYVKSKTIIGREIVFTDADASNSKASDNVSLADMSDSGLNETADINDGFNEKLYVNIYRIPTEKGQFSHIYFKTIQKSLSYDGSEKMYTSEIYLTCDDEISGNDKNIHGGKLTFGVTDIGGDSDTFTADYADLAITKELFQGQINIAYANKPALSMNAQLSTDGDKRLFDLIVPNILTVNLTLSPSELEFKDEPVLIEGQYVEFPKDEENKSALEAGAEEKLKNDVLNFIYKIMGIEPFYEDEGSEYNDDFLNVNEENVETNEGGDSTTLAPTDGNNASETEINKENVSESTEVSPTETSTAAMESETNPTQTADTAPVQNAETETSVPIIIPTVSSIDTGNAQKITGAQVDGFNKGNYYKTEIYVDGEKDASSNVSVTELQGRFDSYIKGKVLQVDFAEGYKFDSALIVLTFPAETISGGRNYPNSTTLKGLNRYMVLGANEGDEYGDKEIECYRYSDRQIGFIAEKSGYYYVVDMDNFFFSVLGTNPDEVGN